MYKQKQQLQEQVWPASAERWLLEWAISFDAWLDTPEGIKWLAEQESMYEERRNAQSWQDRQADIMGWQS